LDIQNMKRFPKILLIPIVFLIITGGFVIWGLTPLGPAESALDALQPDQFIQTSQRQYFEFYPVDRINPIGFIIYPGGRVDWRSYAPVARAIAEDGYYVAIVPMPLSLAVLAPGGAAKVIESHPEISTWAIGGHSLGGAMAANFAYNHPQLIKGLVLWAAYPAENNNLTKSEIKVLSIFASQDGLATIEKIEASRSLLPKDTVWFEVIGGNHAQFGWYGPQPGDGVATISAADQMKQVADATVGFLDGLQE
jgi:hypothetical protein